MTLSENRLFIAVDYGSRRIGLARSDPTGTIASALLTIEVRSRAQALAKLKEIIDEYFEAMKRLIESRIFKNVCHLDTIFRYINPKDLTPTLDCDISQDRVLELGRLCIKNEIALELNLSGTKYPIGRSFPSRMVIKILKKEGARIFVGSDSHSVNYFRMKINKVKKAYKLLNKVVL